MIYEFFMFHNELDMLELKLRSHAPYVDRFVIIESNVRSNQSPKDYVLPDHWERYEKYRDKIIYLKQDGRGLEPGWRTINAQRNFADGEIAFGPRDILLISDLDEFLPHEEFSIVKEHFGKKTNDLKFEMTCYWCYADLRHSRKQRALTAVLGESFKQSSTHRHQDIEQQGEPIDPKTDVRPGGIHLSWFGDRKQFEEKIMGSIEGLKYIEGVSDLEHHWQKKSTGRLFDHKVKFSNKKIQHVDFETNTEIPSPMKDYIRFKREWLLNSKESS